MRETMVIVVGRKSRSVTLLGEEVVTHGKLEGHLRRLWVDDDGGLHQRYLPGDVSQEQLLELVTRCSVPDHLGRAVPHVESRDLQALLGLTHGTRARVAGGWWSREGGFLRTPGGALVPRTALRHRGPRP